MIDEVKFRTVLDLYPRVREMTNARINKESFYVIDSPFANCQTFCFNNAKRLLSIEDEAMPKFMKDLYGFIEKRQCVIDVNSEYSVDILEKLAPFTDNVISTPYISTNKSNMILHIIQFNRDKLMGK